MYVRPIVLIVLIVFLSLVAVIFVLSRIRSSNKALFDSIMKMLRGIFIVLFFLAVVVGFVFLWRDFILPAMQTENFFLSIGLPLIVALVLTAICGYLFWYRPRAKRNEQETPEELGGGGGDYNAVLSEITENGRSDGFQQAGQNTGNADAFDAAVKTFFSASLTRIAMSQNEIEKWRKKKEASISGLMAEIGQKDDQNISIDNEEQEIEKDIDKLKDENIKLANPSNQQAAVGDERLKFKIFVSLLAAIILFLFIFYNSVIYSAFFKQFQLSDLGIVNSIFDAKALTQAWRLGLGAALFTYLFPLVILGISSIVHVFKKNRAAMIAVYAVAFAFDCLLAYEISEKIYNLKAENSFADIAPFSLSLAVSSITFWLIIFLGFVVYIIAGVIFEYTLTLYAMLNPNAYQIKQNKETIALKQKRIEQINGEKKANEYFVSEKRKEIGKINAEIESGMTTKIPNNFIDTIINSFSQGWIQFLSGVDKNHPLISKIRSLTENYIEQTKNNNSVRIKEQTLLAQNDHLQIGTHSEEGDI